jgi:hypothetical protein
MKSDRSNSLAPLLLSLLIFTTIAAKGKANNAPSNIGDKSDIQLQQDRLEFEKEKAIEDRKLERERLDFDKTKHNSDELNAKSNARLSAIATIVPVLAACLTIGFGIWNYRKGARLQFEIKAAEIAFERETAKAVQNRAIALKKMFGDRLPKGFPAPFDLAELGGNKEDPEGKLTFLELILKYPDKQPQITRLWKELFDDDWLERVEQLKYSLGKPKFTEDKKLFAELLLNHPAKKAEIMKLGNYLFEDQSHLNFQTLLDP